MYYGKGFDNDEDVCGTFSTNPKPEPKLLWDPQQNRTGLPTTSSIMPKAVQMTLRPCDCVSEAQAKTLNEQGIAVNDESIEIHPNYVLLTMGHTQVKIGMKRFQMFAEWYLEPQTLKK